MLGCFAIGKPIDLSRESHVALLNLDPNGLVPLLLSIATTPGIWLLRWLLFRFMFMSGVVKLLSGDPNWWNLSALSDHFLTQPLPTTLAWYAARLPPGLLQFATGGTFFVELILPFLIFCPYKFPVLGLREFHRHDFGAQGLRRGVQRQNRWTSLDLPMDQGNRRTESGSPADCEHSHLVVGLPGLSRRSAKSASQGGNSPQCPQFAKATGIGIVLKVWFGE
jgi:hypothetical protein